jgi:outer membrane biosynthesis protein TonB
VIAQATSGSLSVQDGESTRLIPFDASQLRNGSILYAPQTDQILMRLTVTTPTETYVESVTAILPGVRAPRAEEEPPKVAQASQPAFQRPVVSGIPVKSVKAFTPPPLTRTSSSSTASPILQEPPVASERSSAVGLLPKFLGSIPSNFELPPSPPQTVAPNSPFLPQVRAASDTFQPAVVISKSEPKFPEQLRSLLVNSITVEVLVTIDASGKVVKAGVIPQKGLSLLLANSVVAASRLWKFKPALRNRQPVESEAMLDFVFKP